MLVIFAVIAAVLLYQLYAVLGRRVGRQPEDVADTAAPISSDADKAVPEREAIHGAALTGLAALRARDSSFDSGRFLVGARGAYEQIVTAFAEGDRETLAERLAPKVLAAFEKAITDRETKGETQTAEFLHPPRPDLDQIEVDGDVARIRVRFLAEHRLRSRTDEGEAVEDRRTAEVWTFERNLTARDHNWLLVRVEAAEA